MDLSGYDYLHIILGCAILLSVASNVFLLYEFPCVSVNSTSSDVSSAPAEYTPKPFKEGEFVDLPPDTTVGYVGTHVTPSDIPKKVEVEIERHLSRSSNDLGSEWDL